MKKVLLSIACIGLVGCGSGGVRGLNAKQITLYWGFAMGGIDWMARAELVEAIPPSYTEFLGKQLKDHIQVPV